MSEQSQEIIDYIINEVLRSPGTAIDEDTPLVSSGLIDSFALVDILLKLEDVMFETAQRVGKPRK